jgi:uroporphyrinogen-III synthase
MSSKKLFISKSVSEISILETFCSENTINLIAHSFLSFERIPYLNKQKFDVVFFSSKRSIDFLPPIAIQHGTHQIACLGEATSEYALKHGYTLGYTGKNAGNPTLVARDFAEWLGKRTVLFPIALGSLKSILNSIPPNQVIEAPVYNTIISSIAIESCDIYVFTSPSNAAGYLGCNSLPSNAYVIAWGNSTESFLVSNGIKPKITLKHATLEELIQLLVDPI